MEGIMHRLENKLYQEDLETVAKSLSIDWVSFKGATIAISGATGMIGTFLVDLLMHKTAKDEAGIRVIAMGRDEEKAHKRLPYFDDPHFSFDQVDVSLPGSRPSHPADVVIHLASTTHPRAYATDPIGTVTSNIQGLMNLLDYACMGETPAKFVFASSVEVYGQNRGDTEKFSEDYCGYINSNTLRAGYPESKRCGEALCQAFLSQKQVPVFIPRLPRTYGPTMLNSDSKALSQFIKKGLVHEDIVLKSEGTQEYSYLYVADTVEGLLTVLTQGEVGQAYNVADAQSDAMLKDLASAIATTSGQQVIFKLPDAIEAAGYSTATKAMMDGSRLRSLGWEAHYPIADGLGRTLEILGDDADFGKAAR